MTRGQRNTRVAVVYQHLPHYRYGVFAELQNMPGIDFEFLADSSSRDGSIRTLDVALLNHYARLRNVWVGPLLFQRGLLSKLARDRPDAVVFLGDVAYLSTWLGALLARTLGARVVFWTIGWHRPERGLKRLVRLAFYRLAHGLMLYGRMGAEIGARMGYPRDRIFVVGNSDVSSLRSEVATQTRIGEYEANLPPRDMTCIGAVIRLNPVKELHLVIEAAALSTAATGRAVGVLLVGEGPSRERLQRRANELGVPLFLPGAAYSHDELELAYARISVCVIPSVAGLTVLQALRYGCPVVTHDDPLDQAPESEAIIAGLNGSLYARGDVRDLAEQVNEWLERISADPEEVAEACRISLRQGWSPEAQAERIQDIFARLHIHPQESR